MITAELLREAVGCSDEVASRWAPHISYACQQFGIDSPKRLAAFLAQIAHESGGFRYVREIWGPTPAQIRYEGRADLGNIIKGDGAKFCGHGLIQVTGRANHALARDKLREIFGSSVPDFEENPTELEAPQWASLSAAEYWFRKGCNDLADIDDFEAITRKINGGLNGQEDRVRRWNKAKNAMEQFSKQTETTTIVITEPAEQFHQQVHSVEESRMPIPAIPAIIGALLPLLTSAVPEIVKLIKPDSTSANANAAIAAKVFDVAGKAINAANAQEVVERVQNDPAAAKAVREAIQSNWFELVEVGGGLEAARKTDLAAMSDPNARVWRSPSFWAMTFMLPLVYMLIGSVAGLWGYSDWSNEVRTALSTTVVSLIVGGAAGYYWGSTTKRNQPTNG